MAASISALLNWQYGFLPSAIAMVVYIYVTHYFRLWMIPGSLLVYFVVKFMMIQPSTRLLANHDKLNDYDDDEDEDSDEEEEDGADKGGGLLKARKQMLELGQTIQEYSGFVAGFLERISNLFTGVVPLITLVFAALLAAVALLLQVIELRFIITAGGAGAFAAKFISNVVLPIAYPKLHKKRKKSKAKPNLFLEFLARVPNQIELEQYKRLDPQTMSKSAARQVAVMPQQPQSLLP